MLSYQRSLVVYLATVCFCRRFMNPKDRTVDQMIQAARSGKQNIVEGAMASATSKETEIKLTNVALASLAELQEDYRDYLATHNTAVWEKNSREATYVRNLCRRKNPDYENTYKIFVETRPDTVVANILICLIHQTMFLLRRQLPALEKQFLEKGGVREQMTAARLSFRDGGKK
ncbi:MAG: four helix bundle suffix domain-containing protein [Victivallaceae bacterium]|nr:four helix bundle suffix domain-containing protein [Victivallaceae bacterium]